MYLKLFDAKVKPILLYACEAWADSLKNKLEISQMSVLKHLLAVSRKTSNISILLELGRYALIINIQQQAIKYLPRFPHINNWQTKNITNRRNPSYKGTKVDISAQSILAQLQNPNSGKLKFLNSLKDTYGQETYLKIQKLSNRRAITKLRRSNHNLAIETGRWTNTERKNRLCTQCTESKIEDEMHFLFDCPKYSDIIFERLLSLPSMIT